MAVPEPPDLSPLSRGACDQGQGLRRLRRVQVHRLRVSSVPPYGPDNRRERPGLPDAALR